MHLLYPSDPIRTRRPDEMYAEEFAAMCSIGFEASVFSLEEFLAGSLIAWPPLPSTTVIYRGWMLSLPEYENLAAAISKAGAKPLTKADAYASAHHLPNWYPLIRGSTPETHVFPVTANLAGELSRLDWPAYFIKDFVKSLKTSIGSIVTTPEQADTVAAEMLHYRGVIEGGFCVRRVENFVPDTERRYFVLDSIPYAASGEIPLVVSECAKLIHSRFFSIDVALRADGVLRVVEIGDGQVSDIVGWTPGQFASLLRERWGGKLAG